MNRFSMLDQLKYEIEHNTAQNEKYRNFKMTAVIIHDPADTELRDYIKQKFDKLSLWTGDCFLFLTFVTPDIEWKRKHHKHYFDFDKDALLADTGGNTETETETIGLLRNYFGIQQDGSFIALTDNLCSNQFSIFPTNQDLLREQLLDITEYCEEETADDDGSRMRALQTKLGTQTVRCSKQFLDTLIDYASLTSAFILTRGMNFNQQQKEHAHRIMSEIRKNVPTAKTSVDEEDIINAYNAVVHYKEKEQQLESRERNSDHHPLKREPDNIIRGMERESKNYYNSLNVIKNLLLQDSEGYGFDFSAIVLYAGKIIEKELNMSILQLLRLSKGIDMPQYFDTYCGPMGDVFLTEGTNKPININGVISQNRLRSVPIGDLRYAFMGVANSDKFKDNPYFKTFTGEFIHLWKELGIRRNLAAHSCAVSKATSDEMLALFDQFLNNHMRQIEKLKRILSGRR